MYALITTGTFNYLKQMSNELEIDHPLFLAGQSTTLLYAEIEKPCLKFMENLFLIYPITNSFQRENSFFHRVSKPLFPDRLETTYLQFQEECQIIFNQINPLAYKILLNKEKKLLTILTQWKNKSTLNQWLDSDKYEELIKNLRATNKHYLNDPYTAFYELVKNDTE